jgi:hypothetical protein
MVKLLSTLPLPLQQSFLQGMVSVLESLELELTVVVASSSCVEEEQHVEGEVGVVLDWDTNASSTAC